MNALEIILAKLDRPKKVRNGWNSFCPVHPDGKQPALHVEEGREGRVILRCAAGCKTEEVVAALGLTMGDLFSKPDAAAPPARRGPSPSKAPPPARTPDFPAVVERARALLAERRDDPEVRALLARYHGTVEGALAVGAGLIEDGGLRLLFPEYDSRGRPCGAKVRPGRDVKEQDLPGGRHGLLGPVESLTGKGRRVLLAEGGHDLLALTSARLAPDAVPLALPGAGFFTEEAGKTWAERLGRDRHEVTLLLDADEAGRRAEKEAMALLRPAGATVRRLEWQRFEGTEAKDLADLIASGHTKDLATAISSAPGLLRFRTVEELRAMPGSRVEWLLHGLLGVGVVTVLAALMKAGKSTLIAAILRALETGEPFAELETSKATAVYLSEEAASAVLEKVDAFGVHRAVFLTREDFDPTLSFADYVTEAAAEARRRGARLLIVDTFTRFSRLGADQEKDAGAVQAVFEHAMAAAATGLAILVLTHVRKSSTLRSKSTLTAENVDDDPDLEEVRGSSALAAAADAVLLFKRVQDGPSLRALGVLSRFSESPRGWTVLDLKAGRYVLAGSLSEVLARAIEERILAAIDASPEPLTTAECLEAAGGRREDASAALHRLRERGVLVRTGTGKGGRNPDPYRYSRPGSGLAVPAVPSSSPAAGTDRDPGSLPHSPPRRGGGDGNGNPPSGLLPLSVSRSPGMGTGTGSAASPVNCPNCAAAPGAPHHRLCPKHPDAPRG